MRKHTTVINRKEICDKIKELKSAFFDKEKLNGAAEYNYVGKLISEIRHSLNLSAADLSIMLGAALMTIYKWERGYFVPGIRYRQALISVFQRYTDPESTKNDKVDMIPAIYNALKIGMQRGYGTNTSYVQRIIASIEAMHPELVESADVSASDDASRNSANEDAENLAYRSGELWMRDELIFGDTKSWFGIKQESEFLSILEKGGSHLSCCHANFSASRRDRLLSSWSVVSSERVHNRRRIPAVR